MERPFGYYVLIPVVHSYIFYIKNIWNVFLFGNGYLIDELLAVQAMSELINVYNFLYSATLPSEWKHIHCTMYFTSFLDKWKVMFQNIVTFVYILMYFNSMSKAAMDDI
jgi:hypothetical protein